MTMGLVLGTSPWRTHPLFVNFNFELLLDSHKQAQGRTVEFVATGCVHQESKRGQLCNAQRVHRAVGHELRDGVARAKANQRCALLC